MVLALEVAGVFFGNIQLSFQLSRLVWIPCRFYRVRIARILCFQIFQLGVGVEIVCWFHFDQCLSAVNAISHIH